MPFLVEPPLPHLTVEIAFDSGFATPEGDRTWTDVSAWVEGALGVDITYGRADELSTPDPNSLSVTLDNRDGRFTPGKASSPYFPDVKKGKPIRVSVTYAGVVYTRFTGYVNEWPLVWPDGTSAAATVTITAASRRARLGQTAPLTSAIRAAYLADSPDAYWPLDDETVNTAGRNAFLDITNTIADNKTTQALGLFNTDLTKPIILHDAGPHPTDEGGLVKFPKTTNPATGDWVHHIGGPNVMRIGTVLGPNDGSGFELVSRVVPSSGGDVDVALARLFTGANTYTDEVRFGLYNNGSDRYVYVEMVRRDDGVIVESSLNYDWGTHEETQAIYDRAVDGELHHYYIETYSNSAILYFDGELVVYATIVSPLTKPFRSVALGSLNLFADVWMGHAAGYDKNLSIPGGGNGLHTDAALSASETVEERVIRVAGRIGVPADEIDVETSIASPLGPQAEAGRSAAEVIDEAATATGGVLYDSREGHLSLQSRDHRYNLDSSFSLSATLQEIQGDLTVTDDHRYTINTVEFSRVGDEETAASTVTDDASIEEYGVFSQTYSVVSESDSEVESFARNILYRYADPDPRVSQVSVDVVNIDASQRDAVLSADIGTRFGLVDLAEQSPTDPMHLFLEGYSETIPATSHTLSMNTTPGDIYQNVFIWDDPTRGVWDADNVWAY